jgi:hypothetical protein
VKRRTETSGEGKTEIDGVGRMVISRVRKTKIFLTLWVDFPLPPVWIGL